MTSTSHSRVLGLDAMRCVAISLVVLGHGSTLFATRELALIRGFLWEHAFIGVEIFFVLSGFLIGSILLKVSERELSITAIRDFWLRRWFRTLPNYYLFLLVNIVGFGLLKPDFSFDWKFVLFLQNFAWVNERFFSVSWSLAVEEWFYLLLPLCVFVGLRVVRDRTRAILLSLLAFLIAIVAIRFIYIVLEDPDWNGETRLAVLFRLDSLLFGVLAAYWHRYNPTSFFHLKYAAMMMGLLFVCLALLLKESAYTNTSVLLRTLLFPTFSIGFAAFLPCCAALLGSGKGWLEKGVQNISLWSYSLYLLHVATLEIFLLARGKLHYQASVLTDLAMFSAWAVISIAGSAIIYRYFEKPMTDLRDTVTRSRVSTNQISNAVAVSRSTP